MLVLGNPSPPPDRWQCDTIWEAADFSPCFLNTYLVNFPVALAGAALASVAVNRVWGKLRKRAAPAPLASTLVPPHGDNLSRLEASVLVSALAANVTPAQLAVVDAESGSTQKQASLISPREAEKVVSEFCTEVPREARRLELVHRWLAPVGAVIWLATQLAASIVDKDEINWRPVAFPAAITLLSLLPSAPIMALLTLHLPIALLLARSAAMSTGESWVELLPVIVETVYWTVLVTVPYYEPMDGLLSGAASRGGLGAGPIPNHLEEPTSAFSRGSYWFVIPWLWKHYWKTVTIDDMPAIREDDTAAANLGAFRQLAAARDTKYAAKHNGAQRPRNLATDLMLLFMPLALVQAIYACLFIILQYLQPIGLRLFLQYIKERETSQQPVHVAMLYVAMMALGQCLGPTAMGQALMIGRRICVRMRAIIITEVFAKALRREDRGGAVKNAKEKNKDHSSEDGEEEEEEGAESSSDGKIANFVSVDAFAVSEVCAYNFYLISAPVGILVNTVLLYETLGLAGLAGVGVLVLLLPVQTLLGKLFTVFQRRLMAATDARLDTVTEVISYIKLIKYNSWQDKFYQRMRTSRRRELSVLAQRFMLVTFADVLVWGTPLLVTGAAFGVHVLVLHRPLTADRAFASLVLFNMLRDPLALLQDTVSRMLQAYTSCMRIQDFLNEPDTKKYTQLSTPGPSDPSIGFSDALFAHPGHEAGCEGAPYRLGELNLDFPTGKLSLIAGPVGSGKTTLILSLLGETALLKGKVFMPDDKADRHICPIDPVTGLQDTTAYCAQTAWLVGSTIRENITFGAPFDQERYDAVVFACALERDFEIFDLGDATEVGEKGTTCSGGQKARIALARALYSAAKVVILDDVLSAVDAQTARHIYKHVLQGPLMAGRSCLLVTHQVQLCAPAAAFMVMLDGGRVVASGSPAELVASGAITLSEEVLSDEDDETKETNKSNRPSPMAAVSPKTRLRSAPPASPLRVPKMTTPRARRASSFSRSPGLSSSMMANMMREDPDVSTFSTLADEIIEEDLDGEEHDALIANKTVDARAAEPVNKGLVQAETSASGSIGWDTYRIYFAALGGPMFWIAMVFAFLASQVLQVLSTTWVKDWANANDPSTGPSKHSTSYYFIGYIIISVVFLIGVAVRVGLGFLGSLHASNRLYKRLLQRILGAKMRFFDSTPTGRIMNRLSKDMASIDQEAAEIISLFVNCVLSCAAVLLVVTYSTPAFLYSLAVIVFLYWFVGALYVTTSREVKRYDSITRSPLFVSFSEALVGMSTIRSYGDSARFIRKLLSELDGNTRPFWYLWQSNRVLSNLSYFVGTLITISASALALWSPGMSAGVAGLSVTYALSFTEYSLWIVRLYAAAEMSMNSVERVAEYLDLEPEEDDEKKGQEPPAYWPSREGSVVVSNLTCKYAPQLDPVLREVSFTIGPKEKIGICGRTGSGKSTLALSFFRFLFQEGGSIVIDGLDISKLSLSTLRSRLTILPQEAQLFTGSVRENLDPFNQHEDYEVWEVLTQCGLAGRRSTAATDPTTEGESTGGDERVMIRSLDEKVATGGKNFSQGQRQLLALARGLLKLRTSSFLIMDESTANLDHATDTTIQNVLRTNLQDIQMLVIAHRLMTVCGLDKILVLDHGKVVEFGTPWDLLQIDNGSFRDLCRQSGEEAQLFELAKSVHDGKHDRGSAGTSSS